MFTRMASFNWLSKTVAGAGAGREPKITNEFTLLGSIWVPWLNSVTLPVNSIRSPGINNSTLGRGTSWFCALRYAPMISMPLKGPAAPLVAVSTMKKKGRLPPCTDPEATSEAFPGVTTIPRVRTIWLLNGVESWQLANMVGLTYWIWVMRWKGAAWPHAVLPAARATRRKSTFFIFRVFRG